MCSPRSALPPSPHAGPPFPPPRPAFLPVTTPPSEPADFRLSGSFICCSQSPAPSVGYVHHPLPLASRVCAEKLSRHPAENLLHVTSHFSHEFSVLSASQGLVIMSLVWGSLGLYTCSLVSLLGLKVYFSSNTGGLGPLFH